MSLSNSRLAYEDCYKLLDQALDEDRGIRIEVNDLAAANYLRMRIHHARTIDRQENKVTYPDKDHPLHGRSPYDILIARIEGDGDTGMLYLDKQKVVILGVEPIPADFQVEFKSVRLIEGPQPEPQGTVEIIEPPSRPQIRRR
jgi:hypothetical protein